jgi:hypothetical protein
MQKGIDFSSHVFKKEDLVFITPSGVQIKTAK